MTFKSRGTPLISVARLPFPNEREMATINYFRVVDSFHPHSGKSIKVTSNWLPRRILFDYKCFLCAAELCSAMPRGNFIAAPTFSSMFFGLHLTCLALFCAGEAIDTLLAMKGNSPKRRRGI